MTPRKKVAAARETGIRGGFPFPEGHYFSTPNISRNSHSSGTHVRMLNEALGLGNGEIFNVETMRAVRVRQEELGLPVTGVVDEVTWDVLAGNARGEDEGSSDD